MIDDRRIALMKPGAILINTSRGEVVDSTALARALDNDFLRGYGADVAELEPPMDDDPLIHHPHAVVTPHMASLTRGTYREMCVYTVRNLVAVLSDRDPAPESIFA